MPWEIEDRCYLRLDEPKVNAWVVYTQWSHWAGAVFDRAAASIVFEFDEKDLETAKRRIETFIRENFHLEVAPDSWIEALNSRHQSGVVLGPMPNRRAG